MASVYFTTQPGSSVYEQRQWADPNRLALNEELRREACERPLLKQALPNVAPGEMSIGVELPFGASHPILSVWKQGTGDRVALTYDRYSQDPFLRDYALFQCNLSANPPQIVRGTTAHPPAAPPPLAETLGQAQQAAQRDQAAPLHQILQQQQEHASQMAHHYTGLLNTMHAEQQKQNAQFMHLLGQQHHLIQYIQQYHDYLSGRSDAHHAALLHGYNQNWQAFTTQLINDQRRAQRDLANALDTRYGILLQQNRDQLNLILAHLRAQGPVLHAPIPAAAPPAAPAAPPTPRRRAPPPPVVAPAAADEAAPRPPQNFEPLAARHRAVLEERDALQAQLEQADNQHREQLAATQAEVQATLVQIEGHHRARLEQVDRHQREVLAQQAQQHHDHLAAAREEREQQNQRYQEGLAAAEARLAAAREELGQQHEAAQAGLQQHYQAQLATAEEAAAEQRQRVQQLTAELREKILPAEADARVNAVTQRWRLIFKGQRKEFTDLRDKCERLETTLRTNEGERTRLAEALAALQAVHALCGQRPPTPKRAPSPEAAAPAAAAAAAADPAEEQLDALPADLLRRSIDPFVVPVDARILAPAGETLRVLLAADQDDARILPLALYVATHNSAVLRNDPAFLRWVAQTAMRGDGGLAFGTLALALAEPGKQSGPFMAAVEEGQRLAAAQKAAEPDWRNWAKKAVAEDGILGPRLQTALQAERTEALPHHFTEMSLIEQLNSTMNPNNCLAHTRLQDTKVKEWQAAWRAREQQIRGVIDRVLSTAQIGDDVPDQDLPVQSTPVQNQPLGNVVDVRAAICTRLEERTGLATNAKTCDLLAHNVVETGEWPPLIKRALLSQNPEELRHMGQLLYDYIALRIPPKLGGEIARSSDLDWLQKERTPEEGTTLLFDLLQKREQMPKLKSDGPFAYPMMQNQAYWMQNFYRHLSGQNGEPIYADAGTGKTATAELAVRFMRARIGTPVYFLSPFPIEVAGMENRLFERGARDIVLEGERGPVIVDEGHLLHPDAEIRFRDGAALPLIMTATPTIPQNGYPAFKKEQLAPKYRPQLEETERTLTGEEERLRKVRDKYYNQWVLAQASEMKGRIQACAQYLPWAQSGRFSLKPATREDLQEYRGRLANWKNLRERYPNDVYRNINQRDIRFDARAQQLFTQTIGGLDHLLSTQPDDAALGINTSHRDGLARKRDALARKVSKWEAAVDPNAAQYEANRRKKEEAFRLADYHQVDAGQDIVAFAAARAEETREQYIQFIFPTLRLTEETKADIKARLPQRTVMLYDQTNMQGGDYGADSFAGPQHDIEQFIICTGEQNDLTENDLLQAIRRRRGASTLPTRLYASQASKEAFLADARANQIRLERAAIRREAERKIARKREKIGRAENERWRIPILEEQVGYFKQWAGI
jgi:hypothetical protein